MRNKATTLIIVLILIIPSPLFAASWEGKVVSVSDGDTIKVLKDGK